MTKKKTYFTNLESICGGDEPGHIYVAAVLHQMPDPIADQVSYVLDLHMAKNETRVRSLFNGGELIKDYFSGFNCIVSTPGGAFFVGEDSGVIRYFNGRPEVFSLSKSIKMQGLILCAYARGIEDVVFGSSSGALVHLKGNTFSLIKIPRASADATVNRIHGVGANFMVGVGNHGHVVCFRGEKWEKIKSPANSQLATVWCSSKMEIYIGGWFGRAWRWDGDGRWQPLDVKFEGELRSFYICDITKYQGEIYAACGRNGIYQLDGNQFVPVILAPKVRVGKLAVTDAGLVGIGSVRGESGSWLTRFDGTNWTAEQIHIKA